MTANLNSAYRLMPLNTTLAFIRLRMSHVENNSLRSGRNYESNIDDPCNEFPAPEFCVAAGVPLAEETVRPARRKKSQPKRVRSIFH